MSLVNPKSLVLSRYISRLFEPQPLRQYQTSIEVTMAASYASPRLVSLSQKPTQKFVCLRCQWSTKRKASTSTYNTETDLSEDVVPDSSLLAPQPGQDIVTSWDPIQRSRNRKRQLPPSRYDHVRDNCKSLLEPHHATAPTSHLEK